MFSVRKKLEKKRKIKFLISVFVFLISISVFGFCLFKIYENKQQSDKANSEYKELAVIKEQKEEKEEKEEEIPKFHKDLLNRNPDYVGWIEIPGTKIDYPIVQSEDNDKYLKYTFEGNENEVGAIFMDCNCDSDFESTNTVLHGHSRLDQTMFGGLHKYKDENYRKKHSKIVIKRKKDGKEFIGIVFSTSVVEITDPVYTSRGNEEKSKAYVKSLGIGEDKKIITLSTCVSSSPGSTQRRIVQAVIN